MTRIAIPITDDLLSKHFTQCSHYVIYEFDEKKNEEVMLKKKAEAIPFGSLSWIKKMQITDVIANSMDEKVLGYFSDTKINLYIGVAINSPEHIIDEYAKGELRSNTNTLNK